MESKLTDKQKRFVKEYLIDLNGTQAAIRAGYSKKTASEISSRLLTFVNVQNALKIEIDRLQERTDVIQEMVINELKKIAFADIKDFVSFNENGLNFKKDSEVDGTIINEISQNDTAFGTNKKFKLHCKEKALEMLGRHLGMFNDKLQIDGNLNHKVDLSGLSIEELKAIAYGYTIKNKSSTDKGDTKAG